MKSRERNEIIAQILECCNGNRVTRAKIMCDAYLSFYVAREYLLLLLGKGLVEYQTRERTFKATEKGIHFLNIHNNFRQLTIAWPGNLSNLT
jgi:predicted transcriptional regulator